MFLRKCKKTGKTFVYGFDGRWVELSPDKSAGANLEQPWPVPDAKPYANEHSCRLNDPDKYSTFRRNNKKTDDGKEYGLIFGKIKGSYKWELQAIRYPKKDWSESDARARCKEKDGGKFEPASTSAGAALNILEEAYYAEHRGVVPFKETAKADEGTAWDANAATARLRNWAGVDGENPSGANWAKYAQGFAWFDSGKKDTLGAYKLPHHDIQAGRLVVVWRGVAAAMAALGGGRGGVDLPAGDKAGVRSHLLRHYKQFGKEPPDNTAFTLEQKQPGGMPYLKGSWEETIDQLEDAAAAWLEQGGIDTSGGDVDLIGTFDGYAVVGIQEPDDPDGDEGDYVAYRGDWSQAGGMPAWSGPPEEVELSVTAGDGKSTKVADVSTVHGHIQDAHSAISKAQLANSDVQEDANNARTSLNDCAGALGMEDYGAANDHLDMAKGHVNKAVAKVGDDDVTKGHLQDAKESITRAKRAMPKKAGTVSRVKNLSRLHKGRPLSKKNERRLCTAGELLHVVKKADELKSHTRASAEKAHDLVKDVIDDCKKPINDSTPRASFDDVAAKLLGGLITGEVKLDPCLARSLSHAAGIAADKAELERAEKELAELTAALV